MGHHSLHAPNRAKHASEPLRLRRYSGMEHAKLANGNGHEARIGGSASSAQTDQMNTPRLGGKKALRKKMGRESKSSNLVCRYCGSEDLAPSFIKRRDRRCRKCFSKRYGAAAQTRKSEIKK